MGAEALDHPEVQHPIYPSPRSVPHTFDFFPGLASSLAGAPTVGGSSTGGTDLHPGLQRAYLIYTTAVHPGILYRETFGSSKMPLKGQLCSQNQ